MLASKLSSRFGIPALLLFLATGMIAGSEGPGGIPFDEPRVGVLIGSAALCLILFDGGLQTTVKNLDRDVTIRGAVLATVGVMVTAAVVGGFAVLILGASPTEGLLMGAILSSTDAAAVFSVLRSRNVGLQPRLRTLLEFESASNDPTAVFLTVTLIALSQGIDISPALLPFSFAYRLAGGVVVGWLMGKLAVRILNRINLEHDGLYPVLTLGAVGMVFGLAELAGTSGFMAAYLMGLSMADKVFVHKRSLTRFHDGMSWLMQISMFLLLGLLVFPSEIVGRAGGGLAISAVLMFIARPAAVMLCMIGSSFSVKERLLLSWVGLRGAAPIILATFPLVAGLDSTGVIFNTVFFVVAISVLLQGPTLGIAAKWLGLDGAGREPAPPAIHVDSAAGTGMAVASLSIAPGSIADGSRLLEVGGPDLPLVVLIRRQGWHFIPTGSTTLVRGDELEVLGTTEMIQSMRELIATDKDPQG